MKFLTKYGLIQPTSQLKGHGIFFPQTLTSVNQSILTLVIYMMHFQTRSSYILVHYNRISKINLIMSLGGGHTKPESEVSKTFLNISSSAR